MKNGFTTRMSGVPAHLLDIHAALERDAGDLNRVQPSFLEKPLQLSVFPQLARHRHKRLPPRRTGCGCCSVSAASWRTGCVADCIRVRVTLRNLQRSSRFCTSCAEIRAGGQERAAGAALGSRGSRNLLGMQLRASTRSPVQTQSCPGGWGEGKDGCWEEDSTEESRSGSTRGRHCWVTPDLL